MQSPPQMRRNDRRARSAAPRMKVSVSSGDGARTGGVIAETARRRPPLGGTSALAVAAVCIGSLVKGGARLGRFAQCEGAPPSGINDSCATLAPGYALFAREGVMVTHAARVLVVAREEEIAAPLCAGLDPLGWRTVTARGANAALVALTDLPIEVALLVTDGLEDAEALAGRLR